jgi:hypothetical protein
MVTAAPVPRVDISSLSLGPELGSGGQGRVMAVSGFLINGQWPAAVKTYTPEVLPQVNAAALETIVALPRQLAPEDSQWLLASTAWPAVVVEDAGKVCGFLMRAVPQEFYFGFHTQTRGAQPKLADMAFLLNPDQYVRSAGIQVSERDRLALLVSVAGSLSRLHALGIHAGDLSPKNLLFSLAPAPGCFALDCDAMQVRGETVLAQIQTPDWEVPEGEASATVAADSCKFGLLAIRLFACDQSSRDVAPLAAVSPEVADLAERSQNPDPLHRPAPGDWIPVLQAAENAASAVPVSAPPVTMAPATGMSATGVPAAAPVVVPIPEMAQAPAQPAAARGIPTTRPWAKPVLLGTGVAAVLAIVALIVVVLRPASAPGFSGLPAAAGATATAPVAGSVSSSTAGSSTAGSSANQEAVAVNNLLESSASSRTTLVTAVNDVGSCTDLSTAATTIQNVASQRSTELSEASALSTGALPNGAALQSDLVNLLQYSMQADQDFQRWAQQMISNGCTDPAPETGKYQAGFSASKQAGVAKTAFLKLWNPIAVQQGLPTRSSNFI